MANTDNKCKDLEVNDVYSTSKNTLKDIYNLQKDIQENVYGYDFKALQNGNLEDFRRFFDWNFHAISDELREVFDALGGIDDGIGNAVWKPWKKAHKNIKSMSYSEMSESDKKELKMELIDIQHFLFNMMLAADMTEDEIFNYYFSKNEENRRRVENNY